MNTEIRYTGYCNLSDLPVREGDEITLPKGTPYTYRGELRETGRKTRVKVNHVLEGSDLVVGYYQRTSGHYHLGCASEAQPRPLDREVIEGQPFVQRPVFRS